LSDISDKLGTNINILCYEWKNAHPIDTNLKLEGNFPKPSQQAWQSWIKLIKTRATYKIRRLQKLLGTWTTGWQHIRKKFKNYSDGTAIYVRNKEHFTKITPSTEEETQLQGPSKDSYPAVITNSNSILFKKGKSTGKTQEKTDKNQITLPKSIIVVSDASVHPPKAAWAWIIANKQ
jgi:hypothetical protein